MVRRTLARLVWLVSTLGALVLAAGALLVTVEADPGHGVVDAVLRLAGWLDLEVFSPTGGIVDLGGDHSATARTLFSWGLGAIAYLLVGRLLERVLRLGR